MAKDSVVKNLNLAMRDKSLYPIRSMEGHYMCSLQRDNHKRTFNLYSKDFEMEFRLFYSEKFNVLPNQIDMQSVIGYLEVECYRNTIDKPLCNRIYNEDNKLILHDLNQDNDEVVWIEDGECSIEQIEDTVFFRSNTFKNQVEPDFNVEPQDLIFYVAKHFNVESEDEVHMLTLYLVTCFWGLKISHPVLILTGEKGSSKSTTLRKLERIIDPKISDLCGIPKGADGLEIRLSNSYFLALDNLSNITRSVSDLLARASTGGSVTKRALYQNTEEIVLNIKTLLAINSVSMVITESDLLDRCLYLKLRRILPEDMQPEEVIWKEFEADLPAILGCCFKVLAVALSDTTAVHETELTRMADFHVTCIRIGRALGLDEQYVSDLLWFNQRTINQQTLDEDVVAECVIELMRDRKKYVSSVSELLTELKRIAEENSISLSYLPKTPNHLSRRLNKLKSNLEQHCGIFYKRDNVGDYKQITLTKK